MRALNKKENMVKDEIEEIARGHGLEFTDIRYYVVGMNEFMGLASQHGFIHTYPHWTFGMEFNRLRQLQKHGYMRIYEQVINTQPPIAYLLEYNTEFDQRLVMAHVCGHVDFFTKNYAFNETNRQMDDVLRRYDLRIKEMCEDPSIGEEAVEQFLETCYSVQDHIDPFSVRFDRNPAVSDDEDEDDLMGDLPHIIAERGYMKDFLNPEEYKEMLRRNRIRQRRAQDKFPISPQFDVLKFIHDYGDRLKDWEKEILSMVREESYYFAPQGQTKIMNEGWATYWHQTIMFSDNMATDAGLSQSAKHHAGVVRRDKLDVNPYTLGYHLFSHIKDRWDKGRHGFQYELEKDMESRRRWDTNEGKGLEKIMDVRDNFTDIEFIRQFVTQEFVDDFQFYLYNRDPEDGVVKIATRDAVEIRDYLLDRYTNRGRPILYVDQANLNNRKELLLVHKFDGHEISYEERNEALANFYKLWRRPVHLLTPIEDKMNRFSCNESNPDNVKQKELEKMNQRETGFDFYRGYKVT